MVVFASVFAAVFIILLVLLEAGQPTRTATSLYELRRLKAVKDSKAIATLKREELLTQASALKSPLRGALLVGASLLLVYSFGWGTGILIAGVVVLFHGRLARVGGIQKLSNRLYSSGEGATLRFVEKYQDTLRMLAGKVSLSQKVVPLSSRDELLHLLTVSHIFSDEDKKLLVGVLNFGDQTVSSIMTKKTAIVSVKPDELLGPLVLDDLHKTKHEIFPVEKDDEIIGLLDIRDHVALRRKESVYVHDVMYSGVVRINRSEPLDEALRVLVAAKQPYVVVTDDDAQTVGLLGLSDVIRALTGWTRL